MPWNVFDDAFGDGHSLGCVKSSKTLIKWILPCSKCWANSHESHELAFFLAKAHLGWQDKVSFYKAKSFSPETCSILLNSQALLLHISSTHQQFTDQSSVLEFTRYSLEMEGSALLLKPVVNGGGGGTYCCPLRRTILLHGCSDSRDIFLLPFHQLVSEALMRWQWDHKERSRFVPWAHRKYIANWLWEALRAAAVAYLLGTGAWFERSLRNVSNLHETCPHTDPNSLDLSWNVSNVFSWARMFLFCLQMSLKWQRADIWISTIWEIHLSNFSPPPLESSLFCTTRSPPIQLRILLQARFSVNAMVIPNIFQIFNQAEKVSVLIFISKWYLV